MRAGAAAVGVVVVVFAAALIAVVHVRSERLAGVPRGGGSTGAPAQRVRVEVLNAAGVGGMAREATDRLRDAGFDVVQWGNARSFDHDTTVVIDRVGRLELAQDVANAMGIRNVRSEPDSNLYVDVTVLLGRDWSGPTGDGGRSGSAPARAPWDPRGWLGR
jgi:LytR cell envelope-related transcriptional attenuator